MQVIYPSRTRNQKPKRNSQHQSQLNKAHLSWPYPTISVLTSMLTSSLSQFTPSKQVEEALIAAEPAPKHRITQFKPPSSSHSHLQLYLETRDMIYTHASFHFSNHNYMKSYLSIISTKKTQILRNIHVNATLLSRDERNSNLSALFHGIPNLHGLKRLEITFLIPKSDCILIKAPEPLS